MAKRLGGGCAGKVLGREERLEKLENSCAYGGAPVPAKSGRPPPGPKNGPARPLPAGRPSSSGRTSSAARASSHGRVPPKPGSNIHTLGSLEGTGSRLGDTTEAYRQQRGTTAKKVSEVGYESMTPEKAAEVDKARAKVRGEISSTRSASVPTKTRVFGVSGQKISQCPSKGTAHRLGEDKGRRIG
ncbi:unnamed protein product [Symbiodinium pilosum]|uniref:Uncharacterized protein n=1 Tax=Symbiodinium pilosum TaxID=2952 RepID=A0A812XM09_SYMPI|nr:unnamed protein product [Symbiodinium pilosum]